MSNKVWFGLSNIHYTEWDEATSAPKGKPTELPGAVSLTLEREAESSTFYADNKPYYVSYSKGEQTGTLTSATFTDDFLVSHGGYVKLQGGGFAESLNAKPKAFCLAFQVEGDESSAIYVMYNVKASAISRSFETISKNVEIKPEELPITIMGDTKKGISLVRFLPKDTGYDNIFKTAFPAIAEVAPEVTTRRGDL